MTTDWFLRLDPIRGDSTDDRHAGEIDVLSWSWGVTARAGTGSRPGGIGVGAGSGKPDFSDLSVVVPTGRACGELVRACASGQHLPKAVLSGTQGGGDRFDFLTITMSEVTVSSTQLSSPGGDPTQALTLGYAKLEIVTRTRDPRGQLSEVRTGWDVRANRAL